ncbi:uncharacterized protein LOC109821908 [Asparagus officinalis]|uniref:uncharacterized protein LOC109821908 n=1 Tax=Asparagus officinalis TaxID=4686 RepID=UPI00098E2FC4|nr:uncharacterized protein LOC109821908 [Asparagus officinalis]
MRDSESFEIMRESSAYVGSELFRSSQLIKDGLDEVALTEKRKRFTEYVMNMNLPMDQCLTAIGAIDPTRRCIALSPATPPLGDDVSLATSAEARGGEEVGCRAKVPEKYAVEDGLEGPRQVCRQPRRRDFECCGCGTLFERKESYAIHRETCEATVGEEESDGGYGSGRNVMGGVNFGIRANAVNTELLFPSLWGRVSSATGDKNAEE